MAEQSLPPFHTEGVIANPGANSILADTGAIAEGSHNFAVIVQCSVTGRINLEWRDSVGAVKHQQPFFLLASQPFMHRQPPEHVIVCAEGDHIVLTNPNLIAGNVHGTITFA